MKKIIAILLVLTMGMGLLTACGGGKKSSSDSGEQAPAGDKTSNAFVETTGDIKYSLGEHKTASVDLSGLYVSDSMINKALQINNTSAQRFASAFERASNGDEITIAFLGSELTRGEGASAPEKSYAGLVTKWLQDTFPSAKINVVNKGLRHGDSAITNALVNSEVISKYPDIVIVDTAINDNDGSDYENFECLVRTLLDCDAKPAVLCMATCNSSYQSDKQNQSTLCFKYNLPFINCAGVIENNIKIDGSWKWTDISTADDTILLRDTGHAFLADVITHYFQKVIDGMAESSYKTYTMPTAKLTKCRFEGAKFVPAADLNPTCDGDMFSVQALKENTDPDFKDAYTTAKADKATFVINAKSITAVYYQSSGEGYGAYDVAVDGTVLKTAYGGVASNDEAVVYTQTLTDPLIQGDSTKEYTVTFDFNKEKSKDEEDNINTGFAIAGFIIN